MYQGRQGGDCDECEVYPPERSEGGIHTSHIATMSLEVHTTFCVQIGGKSRVACECVVSRGQSSFVRYELRYAQACNATFSARLDTKIIIFFYVFAFQNTYIICKRLLSKIVNYLFFCRIQFIVIRK